MRRRQVLTRTKLAAPVHAALRRLGVVSRPRTLLEILGLPWESEAWEAILARSRRALVKDRDGAQAECEARGKAEEEKVEEGEEREEQECSW